jgi:hypothetical protein
MLQFKCEVQTDLGPIQIQVHKSGCITLQGKTRPPVKWVSGQPKGWYLRKKTGDRLTYFSSYLEFWIARRPIALYTTLKEARQALSYWRRFQDTDTIIAVIRVTGKIKKVSSTPK